MPRVARGCGCLCQASDRMKCVEENRNSRPQLSNQIFPQPAAFIIHINRLRLHASRLQLAQNRRNLVRASRLCQDRVQDFTFAVHRIEHPPSRAPRCRRSGPIHCQHVSRDLGEQLCRYVLGTSFVIMLVNIADPSGCQRHVVVRSGVRLQLQHVANQTVQPQKLRVVCGSQFV